MKAIFLHRTATIALLCAFGPTAVIAADPTSDQPAGTAYNPTPSLEEELVYFRDIIAVQTLRLDETEETLRRQADTLARQNDLIAAQAEKIQWLERQMRLAQNGAAAARITYDGAYIVRSGDTLGKIANNVGSTVRELAAANGLNPPYRLSVGQRLQVPGSAPDAAPHTDEATPDRPQIASTAPQRSSSTPSTSDTTGAPSTQQEERPPAPRDDAPNRPVAVAAAGQNERRRNAPSPQERRRQGDGIEEVGIRPEDEDNRPYVSLLTDVGGILTPKGTLFFEPAIDFTTSSDNRFFFQGIEIADAVLIGAIEATDTDRRAITSSAAFRYGLTDRIEIDGRISHTFRDDRISGVAIDDGRTTIRDLQGEGLGDTELGVHYQVNQGRNFPFAVANMRVKAPTGQGPFDLARDTETGIESELATGSGFWTIEPSMTFIFPSDPAVLFANVGYQANLTTKPDALIGDRIVREFKPGDALRTSIGVGLSLNERMSVNFGYDQSYYFRTMTVNEFMSDGAPIIQISSQPTTTVGSFLFGGSYAVNNRLRLNFNSAIGATDEAADARVTLRANYRLFE